MRVEPAGRQGHHTSEPVRGILRAGWIESDSILDPDYPHMGDLGQGMHHNPLSYNGLGRFSHMLAPIRPHWASRFRPMGASEKRPSHTLGCPFFLICPLAPLPPLVSSHTRIPLCVCCTPPHMYCVSYNAHAHTRTHTRIPEKHDTNGGKGARGHPLQNRPSRTLGCRFRPLSNGGEHARQWGRMGASMQNRPLRTLGCRFRPSSMVSLEFPPLAPSSGR